MIKLETKTIHTLSLHQQTLALAESCTGGLLVHQLTNVAGSSAVLLLGIVAYSNQAKVSLVGVAKALIEHNGAVSADVAEAMSQNIRRRSKSTYGIGITGIAGPGGGTPNKPVGLVYISVSTPTKTVTKKYTFTGSRIQIKKQATQAALTLLLNNITNS